MMCAGFPKRALTISRNVLAPLAFSFTLDAMTEKTMIETLSATNGHNFFQPLFANGKNTHVPQTPYHHPPETPNWYVMREETIRVALQVQAETFDREP